MSTDDNTMLTTTEATFLRMKGKTERLTAALRVIATMPMVEQDSLLSANMRLVAQEALTQEEKAE